jgi:RecB family exonuclease
VIPKSLSASSVLVSEACMARWRAEYFLKTPSENSDPAGVGTSVHYALEHFVRDVYLESKYGWDQVQHLNAYYQIGYVETFNSTNFDTDNFRDGATLVAKWYEQNKEGLANKVLTCEVKENFPIKTSIGVIPFNFIWDRADQIDETTYEVVDYKSIRAPVQPSELKEKIQPRAYALAAQIKWPHAEKIWVTFDMLRYGPVGTVFTRDENAQTYRYIRRAAERIIAQDEGTVEETINLECKWCIRKVNCDTLQKSVLGGTVHGLSIEEVAERKERIANQLLALKYADEELDKVLVAYGELNDLFAFDAGEFDVKLTSRPYRKPNSNAIANIVGAELAKKYGNFTMTNIDKMLASGELTPDQTRQVQAYITQTWSSPSAKVTRKKEF